MACPSARRRRQRLSFLLRPAPLGCARARRGPLPSKMLVKPYSQGLAAEAAAVADLLCFLRLLPSPFYYGILHHDRPADCQAPGPARPIRRPPVQWWRLIRKRVGSMRALARAELCRRQRRLLPSARRLPPCTAGRIGAECIIAARWRFARQGDLP